MFTVSKASLSCLCAMFLTGMVHAQECQVEKIRFDSLNIENTGFQFKASVEMIAKFDLAFGEFETQKISSEVQMIEARLRTLIDAYNTCQIEHEEFKKKLDAFISYQERVIEFSESLGRIERHTEQLRLLETRSNEWNKTVESISAGRKALEGKYDSIVMSQLVLQNEVDRLPVIIQEKLILNQEFIRFVRNISLDTVKKIDERVDALEIKLIEVEKQQKTILAWIQEQKKGELKELHWVLGVVGTSSAANDSYFPGAYITSEYLLPNEAYPLLSRIVPFIEIGHTFWKEQKLYSTLPGGPELIYTEENGFNYYGAGIRQYYEGAYSLSWTLGLSIGYTDEAELSGTSAWSYGALAGLGYYPEGSRVKIYAELRYTKYTFSEETRTFDPFGDSIITRDLKDYYMPTFVVGIGLAF